MKCNPIANPINPAGLDQTLIKLAKAGHDFVQKKAASVGVRIDWWNGPNGLEQVLAEVIEDSRVPNKTARELVTPRSVARAIGVIGRRRKRRLDR